MVSTRRENAQVLTCVAGRTGGCVPEEDLYERERGAGVVLLQGDQGSAGEKTQERAQGEPAVKSGRSPAPLHLQPRGRRTDKPGPNPLLSAQPKRGRLSEPCLRKTLHVWSRHMLTSSGACK